MSPATRANSWSWATAKSWGASPTAHDDHDGGQRHRDEHVARGDRGDRAEEVLLEPARALAAEPGEQDAAGQAAVEEQGQGDVAVGVAALADHLDQDRAEHGHDDRGPGRGGAGQQAQRHPGDGDVADAVAHQGQAALHEVGADRRRGQAGEQRGEQRALHEGVVRTGPSGTSAASRRASSGDATWGAWSWCPRPPVAVVVVVVRARRRSRGGAPRGRPAAGRRRRPGRRASRRPGRPAPASGPSSWATSTIVAPRSLSRPQRVGERDLVGQVDAGGRLVEEEQLGLAGQRPRDQRALLLAARERRSSRRAPGRRARRPRARRRSAARSARESGRSSRRRVSRPAATTSRTEAGTPEVAPVRCGTKPTRCQSREVARAACRRARARRRLSGRSPVSARTSVDLPEPLAPISATNSPCSTRRSMWRRTGRPPMLTAPPPAAPGERPGRRPGGTCGSWTSVAFSSARQVLAHQREVVLAGGLVAEALDRVQHGRA